MYIIDYPNQKIRKFSKFAGSEEGEGAPIELNLGKYDPQI